MGARRIAAGHTDVLGAGRVNPTQDCRPAWRTDGCWGVGLAKEHSLLSKVIHVRGLHGRWFIDVITLDVLPAQIINDDQENVRLGWSLRLSPCHRAH